MSFNFTALNVKGLTDDEIGTVNRLVDKLVLVSIQNGNRTLYYDQELFLSGLDVGAKEEARRIRHVLGWIPKSVDLLARRIVNEGLVVPGSSAASFGLDEYWRANRMAIESSQVQTTTLIHGVAFLVTGKGGPGEPDVLTTSKDALSGTGEWNTRARRLNNFLSITALDGQGSIQSFVLYLPGVNVHAMRDGVDWDVVREASGLPFVPVEPLVYRGRTGKEMGSSRISRAAIDLQNSAVRTMVRSEVTAQDLIDPIRAVINTNPRFFQNADGTPNEFAYALQHSRTIAIPANIQPLDDGFGKKEEAMEQRFEMIQGADMGPHHKQLEMWAGQFSAETYIPVSQLGVISSGQPVSNEAKNAEDNALILEAEGACRDFEPAYTGSARTAWMIMNGVNDPNKIPAELRGLTTRFRDPNTPSISQQSDAMLKQVQSGAIPANSDVVLERMGYSAEEIARIRADRAVSDAGNILSQILGS